MFACNKAFYALSCPKKSFCFVSINGVLKVLLVSHKFQVFQPIVAAIKVFVVNLKPAWDWAVKGFPKKAVNSLACISAVFAQRHLCIAFKHSRFASAVSNIPCPCLAKFDTVRGGYANVQKGSNFFQRSAFFKHAFCRRNLGRVYGLATRNAPHIPQIANLVQFFKPKHRFPCFHALTPFKLNRV